MAGNARWTDILILTRRCPTSLLSEHFNYLSDPIRMAKWREALEMLIPPESTVVDLGAGTGILGLLALRAGAAKVYAIERGPMIHIAAEIAKANGLESRITSIRGMSTEISLPERVDVLVADQIGYFGFNAGAFSYFDDACRRFLKPGGVTLPQSITLQCAPVESSENFELADFWNRSPAGFSMGSAWREAINSGHPAAQISAESLLSGPLESAPLPLNPPDASLIRIEGDVTITRDATLHGLAGFFSAELAPGVSITNSPLAEERIRRAVSFLPIDRPVPVRLGDTVSITVLVRPVEMIVSWTVRVNGAMFRHSTFQSIALDVNANPDIASKPCLGPRGLAKRFVLERCDGGQTLGAIATALYEAFPAQFPTLSAATVFASRQADPS